jgi:hypothetical protein
LRITQAALPVCDLRPRNSADFEASLRNLPEL